MVEVRADPVEEEITRWTLTGNLIECNVINGFLCCSNYICTVPDPQFTKSNNGSRVLRVSNSAVRQLQNMLLQK